MSLEPLSVDHRLLVLAASVSGGGATVTIHNRNLSAERLRVGDEFHAKGLSVPIINMSWSSPNTLLTLAYAWPGTALSSDAAEIHRVPDSLRADQVSIDFLNAIAESIVQEISGLSPVPNRLLGFDGNADGELVEIGATGRALLATASAAEALGEIEAFFASDIRAGSVTIANSNADPWFIASGNTTTVTLSPALPDTDYLVVTEVVSATPSISHAGEIEVSAKATNAFTLSVNGTGKAVTIRWAVIRKA